jgi:GntR family transcriptional regulator of abcA and norABC
MEWRPNKNSHEPIYKQICRYFEDQILKGYLHPGMKLPSERQLAKNLMVNRSTVSEAYDELRANGFIITLQGSGTKVNDSLWGISPLRIPNWHQYTSDGTFLPSVPLHKKVHEASKDKKIINLARGEMSPDLMPIDSLQKILKYTHLDYMGYEDPKGDFELRQAISNLYEKEQGFAAAPDKILITTGGQQAFHLISQCLLKPGDAVAMENPSYMYSLPLFISAGLRLYPIPMDLEGLKPSGIEELYYKHQIRIVFTNPTFQNPTGTVLSENRRQKLLKICHQLRLPIVEDDPYRSLHFKNEFVPPASLLSLTNQEGLIIHIGSVSKNIAPGIRVGWIIGPKSVIERLADAKQQMDFGTSLVTQKFIATYLTSNDQQIHQIKLRESLTKRKSVMLEALNQYVKDKAKWVNPRGGYYIWLKTVSPLSDKQLLDEAIKEGILFFPGSIYGAPNGFIRLNFARENEEKIKHGIQLLSNVLRTPCDST